MGKCTAKWSAYCRARVKGIRPVAGCIGFSPDMVMLVDTSGRLSFEVLIEHFVESECLILTRNEARKVDDERRVLPEPTDQINHPAQIRLVCFTGVQSRKPQY
jgi:hypothetical protein